MRVLFILKQRDTYFQGEQTGGEKGLSSGLTNSALFVSDMLNDMRFVSKTVQVVDNNCIDREVTSYKPDIVIVEAFWVVPEKFGELTVLHPTVKWVIRNHSKTPFLATDGVGLDWSLRYMTFKNVFVSSNSEAMTNDMRALVASANPTWKKEEVAARTPMLPNYYPLGNTWSTVKPTKGVVNIGCFGAIRPLKNQLIQAVAAIMFADKKKLKLRFHVNGTRIETAGDPVIKNLRAIFSHVKKHELVEHSWMPHDDFVKLVCQMDIGLQCSFSETYNIVSADFVSRGVPIVVSEEIDWVDDMFHADPNDTASMVKAIGNAFRWKWINFVWDPNKSGLKHYNAKSKKTWKKNLQAVVKYTA